MSSLGRFRCMSPVFLAETILFFSRQIPRNASPSATRFAVMKCQHHNLDPVKFLALPFLRVMQAL